MFNLVKIRDGHDNFFTPIRLLLALIIVLAHTFAIANGDSYSNIGKAEPKIFSNYEMSYLALNMFFIISGFMITKSLLQSRDIFEYVSARLLRLFPGLIVLILFVMFIVGPFTTQLHMADFFTRPEFYSQPLRVLAFYDMGMLLPQAFEANPEQFATKPLWTIRFFALAYAATLIVFFLGLLDRKWTIIAQCISCMVLWLAIQFYETFGALPSTLTFIVRFGLCYSIGAAIYAYRQDLTFHVMGVAIVGLIAALFRETYVFEIAIDLWLAYFIFWAAYVSLPKLKKIQTMGDISFGVYIYHYCILQWVYHVHPNITTLELFTIALPGTLMLAFLSWRFIEKPALAQKHKLANVLRFKPLSTSQNTLPAK